MTKVDIWLKNVHLAYDVPTKTVRLPPYQLRPPQARDADPRIRALAYQPGRALLPKLRLDGAGFHPAPGPGKRGFLS